MQPFGNTNDGSHDLNYENSWNVTIKLWI